MGKNNFKLMRLISLYCFMIFVISAAPSWAEERVYILSYSKGTLFHQLVRNRTKILYQRAGLKVEFIPLPHNRSLISANEGMVMAMSAGYRQWRKSTLTLCVLM